MEDESFQSANHSITISRVKTISWSSLLPLEVLRLLWGSESLLANLTGKSFSQRESSVLIGVPGLVGESCQFQCGKVFKRRQII